VAGAIAAAEIVLGLGLAFETDAPAGAIIVLGSAAVYLLVLTWRRLRRRPAVVADPGRLPSPSTTQGASR
jgi:ABC-type Mn2+/Zn2+ transport system permease subunit